MPSNIKFGGIELTGDLLQRPIGIARTKFASGRIDLLVTSPDRAFVDPSSREVHWRRGGCTRSIGKTSMPFWSAPQKLVQPKWESPGRLTHGGTLRRRRTAEEVARLLREADRDLAKGLTGSDICQKVGIAETTYYRWRQQYDPEFDFCRF